MDRTGGSAVGVTWAEPGVTTTLASRLDAPTGVNGWRCRQGIWPAWGRPLHFGACQRPRIVSHSLGA